MRVLLAAAAVLLIAACTFPDVDYADGGAASAGATTTSSGTWCAAPPGCAGTAMLCGADADTKYKACVHPCKQDATCIAACNTQENSDRQTCAAACRNCAAPICGSTPTDCDALVGL